MGVALPSFFWNCLDGYIVNYYIVNKLLLETHDMDPTCYPHGSDVLMSTKKWCTCKIQDIGFIQGHVEDMLRTCGTKFTTSIANPSWDGHFVIKTGFNLSLTWKNSALVLILHTFTPRLSAFSSKYRILPRPFSDVLDFQSTHSVSECLSLHWLLWLLWLVYFKVCWKSFHC